MSTLRVTNIQHPNAEDPAIELDPVDGVVFSAASFDAAAITSGVLDAARVPLPPEVAGIGSNVVQTVNKDVFTTTSSTFVTVPDTEVTITPSSADSRILIIGLITFGFSGNTNTQSSAHVRVEGGNLDFFGPAEGIRKQSMAFSGVFLQNFYHSNRDAKAATVAVVDSPNTTSPVTYEWKVAAGPGATAIINKGGNDTNNAGFARTVTSLVAIEVTA